MFNENLKPIIILASVFLAVLILFFGVKIINEIKEGKYIGQDIMPTTTINVTGKGEVFIKPDIAKVSVSVEKEALSVVDAQSQATEVINKVITFLKNSGIEEKDIKTTGYNIYPRYDYIEKIGRVFGGYVVNQTLEIKIRKTEEIGKILTGISQAGANQVAGISFTIDDEEAVKKEARQKAIIDAKTKAEQLAKDLGVKLVRLVSFSEGGGEYPYPIYKSEVMGVGGGPEAPPEIPTGENQIIVNVNLTFEIK